jgi:hypothetical protein
MPERLNPSARINAENMITTADLLKPENASWGVRIPVSPRLSNNMSAITSGRRMFLMSKRAATLRKMSVRLV